jgi:hypothetical protein
LPRGGKNKRSVALICHLLPLKFATLAKGGTELSRGGKNKRSVALICHLFGIDMPCGGRGKLPPLKKVAIKFKRWQLYCIYDIIATIIFLQELQ